MMQPLNYQAPNRDGEAVKIVDACSKSFKTHGAVVINNVFSPDYLDEVNRAYRLEYGGIMDTSREVGHKRTMIVIEMKPPFNGPALFAPVAVLPIIRHLLGGCILDVYVAVTSRPGSGDQHVHVDFPFLFNEDESMPQSLPQYAITLAIPLIALDAMKGVTRNWPGSQRHQIDWKNTQPDLMDSVSIIPRYGGCFLFDVRLLHGGTANCSQAERPVLYLVYCRPWWRDSINFYRQKPLVISHEVLMTLPSDLQPMFRYAC